MKNQDPRPKVENRFELKKIYGRRSTLERWSMRKV